MRSVNVPPTSTPSRFIPLPSRRQEDLPEVLAPLHRRHRLARVREGERLVDEWSDLAPAGELETRLDLVARVDEGADDLLLRPEEGDDVEGHDLAGVPAADHEPPVLVERVEALLEELPAHVLEHDVRAAAVRDAHDLVDDV